MGEANMMKRRCFRGGAELLSTLLLYLVLLLLPRHARCYTLPVSGNASSLYPYYTQVWLPEHTNNGAREWNYTVLDLVNSTILPYDFVMAFFLANAGNISDNCTAAAAWYHSHDLGSSSVTSLPDEFDSKNFEFTQVAASSAVEDLASLMSKATEEPEDRELASFSLYPQLANLTKPIGDAVLNITRPIIELHCISQEMAKAVSRAPGGDCEADLVRWWPPGLNMESSDMVNDMKQAFTSLPEEYKNISIQTFFGWMGHQNFLGPTEIAARKRECYQTICSSLENSGNPDIAGIGMFISYIIEACLATLFILQSCWHNWKHRKVLFSDSKASTATSENFTRIMDMFLNTGVVLLLSLAAALVTVGLQETILYNGVITHLACHFSASAVIAVASLPRYGSHRHPAFWICLLCSTLLSTIAMNVASQYDVRFTMPELPEDNNLFELWLATQQLAAVPLLQFLTGASGYPGLQQISQPDPSASFTVASCLLWGFFYYDGDVEGFITSYVPFSFYFQEVIYFVGILVFFVLTIGFRVKAVQFWPSWPSWMLQNKSRLVFWLRCAFSFVAWMNMFMGLGCITLWRRFQSVAMGSYYSEAAVSYGQVVSLFIWAPVLASLLYTAINKDAWSKGKTWFSQPHNILERFRRRKTPNFGVTPQNNIPLLPVSSPQPPSPGGAVNSDDVSLSIAETSQPPVRDPRDRRVTTFSRLNVHVQVSKTSLVKLHNGGL